MRLSILLLAVLAIGCGREPDTNKWLHAYDAETGFQTIFAYGTATNIHISSGVPKNQSCKYKRMLIHVVTVEP